jgi:hypothetical protein
MTTATKIEFAQQMIADDDTLIITDPCYIMHDRDWEHFLDLELSSNPIGLDRYLKEYHNFGEVIAADTGYGDWTNEVIDNETKDTIGEFSADAGMVIVCTASDLTNYGYDKDKIQQLQESGCLAVVPNFTGTVKLVYEIKKDSGKLAILYGDATDINDTSFHTLGWATEDEED